MSEREERAQRKAEFETHKLGLIKQYIQEVGYDTLISIIMQFPKLRSVVIGYIAEYLHLTTRIDNNDRFTNIHKPSDNGKDANKDLIVDLDGKKRIHIQMKSVYTESVHVDEEGHLFGYVGCTSNEKTYVMDGVEFKTRKMCLDDIHVIGADMHLVTGVKGDFWYLPKYAIATLKRDSKIPESELDRFADPCQPVHETDLEAMGWVRDLASLADDPRVGESL
jgi:hypothetical protein